MDFELVKITYRSVLAITTLFLVAKLLGKKQVSELSLFEYVLGISMGNFASDMSINLEEEFLNAMCAIIVFGMIGYFISFLTMKSMKIRKFFVGVPTVLIQHGHLMQENMKKTKFDVNDLLEEARSNGYFDISEIEFAVLEATGNVSFLPKGLYKPVTIKDMKLKDEKQGLCANVIIDGNIMIDNLISINKDEKWLLHELKVRGKEADEILLATVDINDKLNIYDRKVEERALEILE